MMYEFFVRNVVPKIDALATKTNILAIGPEDESDHDSEFYHPEIHNEVRMAFSHLARHEVISGNILPEEVIESNNRTDTLTLAANAIAAPQQSAATHQILTPEEEKVNSHIQRANMDADKLRYLDLVHDEDEFEKSHDMKILADLDGGSFYTKLTEKQNEARLAFEDAKVLEALGFHDMATEKYRDAGDLMEKALKYLSDMNGPISNTKKTFLVSTAILVIVAIADVAVFAIPFFIG